VCCNSLFRPVAGSNCELDSDSLLAAIASHEQKQIVINTNTSHVLKNTILQHFQICQWFAMKIQTSKITGFHMFVVTSYAVC
jgi:hypothetical protein